MNPKRKAELFKKAERQLKHILENGSKAKSIELPKIHSKQGITRQQALDLGDGFKIKGMSTVWIKDTMLVMWKIEDSKQLEQWHLKAMWDMLNSVNSDIEYKNLLIEVDIF